MESRADEKCNSNEMDKETEGPKLLPVSTTRIPEQPIDVKMVKANEKPPAQEQQHVEVGDYAEESQEAQSHIIEENIATSSSPVFASTPPSRPRRPSRAEVPGAVRVGGSPRDDEDTAVSPSQHRDSLGPEDVMVTAQLVSEPELASLLTEKPWWRQRRNQLLVLAQIVLIVALVLGLYFGLREEETTAPSPTAPLFPTQAPSTSQAPTRGLTWRQVGQAIEGNSEYHYFGTSVAITPNGTTIAVGSSPDDSNQSYVEVYQLEEAEDTWTPAGNINIIADTDSSRTSADSVFLNENADTLITFNQRTGLLQIFDRETSWTLRQELSAPNLTTTVNVTRIHQLHVSSDGSAAVIAFQTSTYPEKVVQVYNIFPSGLWEKGELFQGNQIGSTYNLGRMVAVSHQAREVVIGGSGNAMVYHYGRDQWITPGSQLTSSSQFNTSSFGRDVIISGDGKTVAVSDPDSYGSAGSVTVFRSENVGEWSQLGRVIVGDLDSGQTIGEGSDEGNLLLSDDGNIVGVNGKIGTFNPGTRLKTFQFNGDDWDELDNIQDFNTDEYPCAISGDGTAICCGSPFDLTNGDDIGNVTVYRLER